MDIFKKVCFTGRFHCQGATALVVLLTLVGCSSNETSKKSVDTAPAKDTVPAKTLTVLEMLASNCPIDQFKVNGVRSSPALGQILAANPKSSCVWPPPVNTNYLHFAYGIDGGALATSPKTGGVIFRVSLQDQSNSKMPLWSRALNPVVAPGDRGLQLGLIKLPPMAGSRLVFETESVAGPLNNWAYWANVAGEEVINPLLLLSGNKMADQFGISGLRNVAPIGQLLFAHPRSQFALPLADSMQSVEFSYGILDAALKTTPIPEGVEFRVILEHENGAKKTLWTHVLKPAAVIADRGSHKDTVALQGNGGDRLIFETVPVKADLNNWAYWSGMNLKWAN